MILSIQFDERNVLEKSPGRILLRVKYYAAYAEGCYLATTRGTTAEDFDKADKAQGHKHVMVGQRGGIRT
jgi:hypothetical protein